MLGIPQAVADRCDKAEDEQQEHQRQRPNHSHHRREDRVGLMALIIGKAKQRSFHAKGEKHQDECRIGIDIRAHTIVARCLGHVVCVERHQQIVQESAYNTGKTIDGRVFYK